MIYKITFEPGSLSEEQRSGTIMKDIKNIV